MIVKMKEHLMEQKLVKNQSMSTHQTIQRFLIKPKTAYRRNKSENEISAVKKEKRKVTTERSSEKANFF